MQRSEQQGVSSIYSIRKRSAAEKFKLSQVVREFASERKIPLHMIKMNPFSDVH